MLRNAIFSLALLVLLPWAASATTVSISIEPWKTYDGNFGFSIVHAAGETAVEMDDMNLYRDGEIDYKVEGETHYLTGDLTDSVLTIDGGSLSLNHDSTLILKSSVLDFNVADASLIGGIGYELVDAVGSVESGSFYFYNFVLSRAGECLANGYCPDTGEYRLWGNNWENALADKPEGNVTVDGFIATRHRGIDLGGNISAPVPEPSAALLFGIGFLVAGRGLRPR